MMERYDSYKDSGVEWIGEIPRHWIKNKLKHISLIVTGNTPPTKDDENFEGGEYLWVKPNEIKGFYPTNETQQKLTEIGVSLSRVIPPYSVFVNGIGRIGEFGYSEKPVSTNQQINSVVFNNNVNKRFGIYLVSILKEGFLLNSEKVVVPILNKTKQENIDSILPPLSEQSQIVQFLDEKTSLIDSLIEKTKRKIELLKEERTSLINHTVTKGLNPNVELKDSGVEWIGEIPIHWEFIPVKYSLLKSKDSIRTGPFGSSLKSDEFIDEGVRVYNQRSVYDEDFSRSEIFVSEEKFEELKSFEVKPLDILITSRGTIGKMTIVPQDGEKGVLHPCLIRLRIDRNKLFDKYLWFYVNQSSLFIESVLNESNSTTIEVIYSDTLSNVKFPLPPLSEQEEIVSFLDEKTSTIDKTIELEGKRIDYLKEYRQSLISEVVTGKIKVITDE